MTLEEKRQAQMALTHLTEKQDESIKGRTVHNGKPTREWLSREESASLTASIEGTFLTALTDAWEQHDAMSSDTPNTFMQAKLKWKSGQARVIMKIAGVLVELLSKKAPHTHKGFVELEHGEKVTHLVTLKAICGMLESALLWHRKFRGDLEMIGFVFNAHNVCIANRKVNRNTHTVRFHVDDLMSSHMDSKVNDEFSMWLNKQCGECGEVKATRGSTHDYLGMTFRFKDGKVEIDMVEHARIGN